MFQVKLIPCEHLQFNSKVQNFILPTVPRTLIFIIKKRKTFTSKKSNKIQIQSTNMQPFIISLKVNIIPQ